MICPVEIARDLSAFQAVRVGDHAKHGFLLEGRDGAGDESTGSDLTGDGETDYQRQRNEPTTEGTNVKKGVCWFYTHLSATPARRRSSAQDRRPREQAH